MQAGSGGLSHLTDTIDTAIQLLRIHLCHGQTAAAPRGGLQSELLRAGGAKCREGLCWCSRKYVRCGVVHLAYQRADVREVDGEGGVGGKEESFRYILLPAACCTASHF